MQLALRNNAERSLNYFAYFLLMVTLYKPIGQYHTHGDMDAIH